MHESNGDFPANIAVRLRQVALARHLFVVSSGVPGLGRTMQAYIFARICKSINIDQRQHFYSDGQGLHFLGEAGVEVNRLSYDVNSRGMNSIGNSKDVHDLLLKLADNTDTAVVVDGHHVLTPLIAKMCVGPVLSLANEYDLSNPRHSPGQRLVFRAFHASADVVLAGAITSTLSVSSVMGTPALTLPALVREEFLNVHNSAQSTLPLVVCGLGGGSVSEPNLSQSTLRVVEQILRIANATPSTEFELYVGPEPGAILNKTLPQNVKVIADTTSFPRAVARSTLLICRAGRSTVAEVLASGKPAIIVPAKSNPWREEEQIGNARHAAQISRSVEVVTEERLNFLPRAMKTAKPGLKRWSAGNNLLRGALAN